MRARLIGIDRASMQEPCQPSFEGPLIQFATLPFRYHRGSVPRGPHKTQARLNFLVICQKNVSFFVFLKIWGIGIVK